ncbi:MAG: hypothetical protein KY468_15685, partial [Armatimonadetes bacterium]|nr:hypothetical protein [Armatimonadota bacterium]
MHPSSEDPHDEFTPPVEQAEIKPPPGPDHPLISPPEAPSTLPTGGPPHAERSMLPPPPEMTPRRRRFVTLRATLIGLLIIPFMAYWATDQAVDIILSLMVPPISAILILLLLNWPVKRFAPRLALGEGEFILIYGMLSIATAIAAEWTGNITPLIYSFALFADERNRYDTLITPHVSPLFFIKDKASIPGFREGGHGLAYMLAHLTPWWTPILMWTLFVSLLALAMLFITSLFRAEWTEREKLTFPIIQLPVALTAGAGDSPFWRSGLMWGAFGIMFSIDMLNGFAFLYPSVPRINVRFLGDLSLMFSGPPFNAIGWTPIGLFPFITAMAMFLPSDLLFSAIFFFFFRKAQQVVAASLGYPQGVFGGGWLVPAPPYFSEQSWGAFLGLFFMALWIARHYLKEVWASIRTGRDVTGREMVPHRWAFVGLVGCVLGLCYLATLMRLSPFFMLLYLALFFAFSVALTRMRAELGPPTHEMAFMGPNQLIVDFAGTKVIPPHYIPAIATQFHFMNRLHRSHPMPSELEAMKMAERPRMVYTGFFVALALAIVFGSLCAHFIRLYLGYRWGAPGAGGDVANVVSTLQNNPRNPNPAAITAVFGGRGVVFLLNQLRFTIPNFPLNPVGYALGMNFGVDYFWFGLLVAFVVKT